MIHYYIISHDTELNEWQIEHELESEMFMLHTIYDPILDEWHRSFIGDDEFFPNEERLSMDISAAITQLNNKK